MSTPPNTPPLQLVLLTLSARTENSPRLGEFPVSRWWSPYACVQTARCGAVSTAEAGLGGTNASIAAGIAIQVPSGSSGAKRDATGMQVPLTRVEPSGQRCASFARRSEIDAMVALVESWVDDCESSPSDWLASAA